MMDGRDYFDMTGEPYLAGLPNKGDVLHLGSYGYCKVAEVFYLQGDPTPCRIIAQQLDELGRWVNWPIHPGDFYKPTTIH